jgi:hypothetical protein
VAKLQEGPVELGEEAEFALRMALARIHHLYAVLDLARLDLYGPVKQLLDAQVSGMFPMQYEKVRSLEHNTAPSLCSRPN